jgi:ferric-dicitrate binding protein FerR (iron transport regulator)
MTIERDRPELADADESALEGLLTRAHQPPRIDGAARARILARLKQELPASSRVARPTGALVVLRRRAPHLAVLCAAAALLLLWWTRAVDTPVTHKNDGRAPRAVALRDGSTVVLDAGAEIIELRERRLSLVEGRALLDVKQAAAPFVVESADGSIENGAGRFVVAKEGDGTRVAVARGRATAEATSGEAVIGAGQTALLRAGAAPVPEEARRLSYLASFAQDALAAGEARDESAVRRGNLLARIPDSEVTWPLALRELTVDVRVEDGVVRATLDQTFFNHINSDLEGVYSFPLPPDAAISRLAMYVDGRLNEGGIVERDRGRDIYEGIVYRRRDPALLEWMNGNEFRVRVFPLPARSEKRIILSYTQPIERLYDTARVEVPLPEIDVPVARVNYRVRVVGGDHYDVRSVSHAFAVTSEGEDRVASFSAENEPLGQDIVLSLREEKPAPRTIASYRDASGTYLMARVQPELPAASAAPAGRDWPGRDWVVLFDTSASRDAAALAAQRRLFAELARQWDVNDRFSVVAFDASVRVLPGGPRRASDAAALDEALSFLAAESAARIGVTDVASALGRANELFGGRPGHVLYLGDGVATAGETRPAALAALIPGHTFVGVAVGSSVDRAALEGLAQATGGTFAAIDPAEDLGWRAFDLVSELNVSRLAGVEAELFDGDGREVKAEIHASARASGGADVVVLARVKDAPPGPLVLALHGRAGAAPWDERVAIPAEPGQARYIPELWARRHIEGLLAHAEDNREAITDLALDHFLVTPFTSLLVLETEADYAKHRVARPKVDGWAFYQAPAQIETRVEPIAERARPFGATVLRRRPSYDLAIPDDWGVMEETVTLTPFRLRTASEFGLIGLLGPTGWGGENLEQSFADTTAETANRRAADPAWWRMPATKAPVGLPPGVGAKSLDLGKLRGGFLSLDGEPWSGVLEGQLRLGKEIAHARLDDLSAFVPALFADGADVERQAIAPHRSDEGTVTAEAVELLGAAAVDAARYRAPGGEVVSLAPGGAFGVSRRTALDLAEEAWFDGERLVAVYPELELVVRREIGAAMALLRERAPFVTPTVAQLQGRYDVRLSAPRVLAIAPLGPSGGGGGAVTELTLDERGRVIRWARQGRALSVSWSDDGFVVEGPAGAERFERLDGAGAPPSEPASFTAVDVPVLERAALLRSLDAAEPRSRAWRQALRQLMALEAALGEPSQASERLRDAGETPARGERVLMGLRGGAAEKPADLPARYLAAVANGQALEKLAGEPGLVGALSALHGLRDAWGTGLRELRARYDRLLERRPSLELRHAALALVGDRFASESANEAVALWDDLAADAGAARPLIQLDARLRAATALVRAGRRDEAAERFEDLLRDADAHALYPPIPAELQSAVLGSVGGSERMRWLVLERRTRLLDARTPHALLAAVEMLATYGVPDDLEVVVNALREVTIADDAIAYRLASLLSARSYAWDAERILAGHTAGEMAYPGLLLLGEIAARDDRVLEASELMRRAMDARPLLLTEMREIYRRRFQLLLQGGRQAGEERLPAALAVAADWRKEDPDNAEIDVLCFRALAARGARDEAWRHLSSIIERHPGEGSAHAQVAQALLDEGHGAEADRELARAFEVEPTNPTWLLRRGDLLASRGDERAARALFQQIVDGTWQDRFAGQVSQARSRL